MWKSGVIKMTLDEYLENTREQFATILPTLSLEDIKRVEAMASLLQGDLNDRYAELVIARMEKEENE